ncbi:MAG: hypothetical protein R3B09_28605, partial [Nannocystaceae bacterium]
MDRVARLISTSLLTTALVACGDSGDTTAASGATEATSSTTDAASSSSTDGSDGSSGTSDGTSGGESSSSGGESSSSSSSTGFDDPVQCSSDVYWTMGDHESPFMHPGMACVACHKSQTFHKPPIFLAAGTVYPSGHEPDECNGV